MFHPEYIVNRKVIWNLLHLNPNSVPILEQNLDGVNWKILSVNPNAIHLLERNPTKIEWSLLCLNTNAIHLLAHLDTEKMRENCRPFAEELAAYVFHPLRLRRICEKYGLELEEYFELV